MNLSKPKVAGRAMPNCPVCGQTTYSSGGIHPQCALTRADERVRAAQKKAEEKKSKGRAALLPRQQWTKQCTRCKRQLPARRAACECGFVFLKKKA